jgi:UDP-3-O-[3-hydroxymyristoyl] glucosamine N-acyltransferase
MISAKPMSPQTAPMTILVVGCNERLDGWTFCKANAVAVLEVAAVDGDVAVNEVAAVNEDAAVGEDVDIDEDVAIDEDADVDEDAAVNEDAAVDEDFDGG